MSERISLTEAERDCRTRQHLDMLWDEARAALMVRWRVDTPEVRQEVRRALSALLRAMEEDIPDTS